VVERIASLEELERHYSIDDVADANDALDAMAEARAAAEKAR
jgi:hypothetical protein